MRNQHTHAREIVFAETPPQRFVEAGDAVIGVGCGFAVGDAIEEMAVVGALLPHAAHFGGAGLEVSEILFAEAGFLVDFDRVPWEGRGRGGGGGQGVEEAFGGFACAAVGRGEEVESVIGAEEGAEFYACFFCLEGDVSVVMVFGVGG